ncbi:hypothetical protein NM208_g5770 [Fusarium decemcellulare]|uniref:Uncharacterized protein n=1 Tax=Fusarium decemcellulare TaxID=57161 RepID=A0ACC1SFN2_9HYPO|nr:hypothetical protein NM208_g5770 [Fusarium decemcellulare]
MAPEAAEKKTERSYLSSAVDSINPWASSRSTTPTQKAKPEENRPEAAPANPDDHSTTHLYGQSFRAYPEGCPPLQVQWFHAVDVPKRKPRLASSRRPTQPEQPPAPPKKYSAFSPSDSNTLEAEYQRLLEAMEDNRSQAPGNTRLPSRKRKAEATGEITEQALGLDGPHASAVRVPVNEDFLFDVDIETRELGPVYWLGPVYEGRDRSPSGAKQKITPKASRENLKSTGKAPTDGGTPSQDVSASSSSKTSQNQMQPQSYRLFGTYMNSMATYQDANTAWLTSDSMLSWVTSSVYQRFAGGSYMSGVKLIRGYSESSKSKEKDKDKDKSGDSQSTTTDQALTLDERQQKMLKRRSAPPSTHPSHDESLDDDKQNSNERDPREIRLERQLSSLIESEGRTKAETEEEIRRREEQEIQDDYNAQAGETQGREIEHLVLVTHGIGQLLSLRTESVNFVHDVNVLRKTIKSVYTSSADLKALNSELGPGPGNCRVQVLPVCWRHLLDFPKKREKKGERDLGDIDGDEDDYPSLDDITIEGVAFARSLISDLALDVLLYQSSYRDQIARIVLNECNRIFKLFKERNPDFKGKIHLMGHSLGSAILFDLLCQQKQDQQTEQKSLLRLWPLQDRTEPLSRDSELDLNFDVQDFFCLGSPVGLFQMLKGRTIAARQRARVGKGDDPQNMDIDEDVLRTTPLTSGAEQISPVTGLPTSISSPKVQQLFNIFHPSDPISYRLEPLISPPMSALKPQLLPYTKRGIFGNVAPQGLTGIGAKVGQSGKPRALEPWGPKRQREGDTSDVFEKRDATDARMRQLANSATGTTETGPGASDHNPTLIDDELETLFSKFQQSRTQRTKDGDIDTAPPNEDRKARKMRREEGKVRALNRNGRVDYSIQESVLDFNPINTIASHMGAKDQISWFQLSLASTPSTSFKKTAVCKDTEIAEDRDS